MIDEKHPKLGQEYIVADDQQPGLNCDTVVPRKFDDTGNLIVDHFDADGSKSGTLPWNEDAFIEHIEEKNLVEPKH